MRWHCSKTHLKLAQIVTLICELSVIVYPNKEAAYKPLTSHPKSNNLSKQRKNGFENESTIHTEVLGSSLICSGKMPALTGPHVDC